jgi:cell shape-determining protein MreD
MIAEPNQVALLACYVLAVYAIWHLVDCNQPVAQINAVWPMAAAAIASCALVAVIPTGLAYLFVEQSSRPAVPLAEAALRTARCIPPRS